MLRNPLKGVPAGAVALEPPPSQLISRRPPARGPGALPLTGLPMLARNRSTVPEMDDGSDVPPMENTWARAAGQRASRAVATAGAARAR